MTAVLAGLVVVLAIALAVLVVVELRSGRAGRSGRSRRSVPAPEGGTRILFPFTANALSPRALDAALRLAVSEQAVLVPVFLAHVGLRLPLEAPLPRQSARAITLQEAIEQRAAEFGIAVDARIERGRTLRHALRQTIDHERYDRLVVAAGRNGTPGLQADIIAWLLENAPGEIVVLRPGGENHPLPAVSSRSQVPSLR
jgi:nucleotide-binding universal stress UspA family protein